MPSETRMRALLRPVPVLAASGVVLADCNLPPYPDYGGGGGTYYSPPSYHSSRSHHRRSESHQPRTENWSQQRLQQHWQNQARQAR